MFLYSLLCYYIFWIKEKLLGIYKCIRICLVGWVVWQKLNSMFCQLIVLLFLFRRFSLSSGIVTFPTTFFFFIQFFVVVFIYRHRHWLQGIFSYFAMFITCTKYEVHIFFLQSLYCFLISFHRSKFTFKNLKVFFKKFIVFDGVFIGLFNENKSLKLIWLCF